MMKNKKWLALLMTAALVPFAFAGCNNGAGGEGEGAGEGEGGKPQVNVLPTPELTINGNILSWDAVEDAESYTVYTVENGQNKIVSEQTGLYYQILKDVAGDYNYYVVAQNQTKNIRSARSLTITYTLAPDTSTKLEGNVYLVGDSTVCAFSDDYYLPRYGYGTQLYNYLNCETTQIKNLAMSGRSSKSYLTEGSYSAVKNGLKAGDYLIIGFGHNDEKSGDRFTSPTGDKDTAGSFQNVLYQNYVKLAKDKGATPILCTPIVRYDEDGKYTGSKVHVTGDGDYAQAIRNLGEATDTTVIDLTTITKDIYKQNNAEAQYYHAHTSYTGTKPNETPTGRDDTHINMYGAKKVAYELTQALLETDCTLKTHVKTNSYAPTKLIDYAAAIKQSYVRPDYSSFDPSNTTATKLGTTTDATSVDWYASAMGDITAASNFTISYDNGAFTVGNSTGHGKFASVCDGFAAAFIQIDASKNFTAIATVKVTAVGTPDNQSGFGMMLRDDVLVNTAQTTLNSNYVAAGILNTKGAIFSREKGTLSGAANSITKAAAVNDTYQLEIKRVGQEVFVKVNSYTKTYTDFDFVAVDNGHMYICLFANRGITAEFSNVRFEITGNSEGA